MTDYEILLLFTNRWLTPSSPILILRFFFGIARLYMCNTAFDAAPRACYVTSCARIKVIICSCVCVCGACLWDKYATMHVFFDVHMYMAYAKERSTSGKHLYARVLFVVKPRMNRTVPQQFFIILCYCICRSLFVISIYHRAGHC